MVPSYACAQGDVAGHEAEAADAQEKKDKISHDVPLLLLWAEHAAEDIRFRLGTSLASIKPA